MEREKPVTGEVYHVFNRGVDKRDIFDDDHDRVRFVHNLWEFNDTKPAANSERTISRHVGSKKSPVYIHEDRHRV